MFNRIFMPPLDSKFRLVNDTPVPSRLLSYSDLAAALSVNTHPYYWPEFDKDYPGGGWQKFGIGQSYLDAQKRYWDWTAQINNAVFPAGTVFIMDRYHVSHSGKEEITVRLLASPDPRLTPKKQGGKLKGTGRLYLTLKDLNALGEVECIE